MKLKKKNQFYKIFQIKQIAIKKIKTKSNKRNIKR
jgi:hypothetical protein